MGKMIEGSFKITSIDNEPLVDVMNRMEEESECFRIAGYSLVNSLAKDFSSIYKGDDRFMLDADRIENIIKIEPGFETTTFHLGAIYRNSKQKVKGMRKPVDTEEFVKIQGRSTRPWFKNKKAVMTIDYKLLEENCKYLGKMLSSKFFRDKFEVEGAEEFIQKYTGVKTVDHSALFDKSVNTDRCK